MSLYMEEEGGPSLPFDTEETANLVIEAALEYEGCPYEAEINLLLTSDEDIRDMNQMFRQIDKATDVLSFPMLEYQVPGIFLRWKSNPRTVLIRNQGNLCWGISSYQKIRFLHRLKLMDILRAESTLF